VRQPEGKFAVIGKDQETLRVKIKASYRINPLFDVGQEIMDDGPALRVMQGAHIPEGLVEEEVELSGGIRQPLAVDYDRVDSPDRF